MKQTLRIESLSFRGILVLLLTAVLVFAGGAAAQPVSSEVPLVPAQIHLERLAAGSLTGSLRVLLDLGQSVDVIVTSTVPLTVSLHAPQGEVIDPRTVQSLGGEHFPYEESDPSAGTTAFNQLFHFPSFGPGEYEVRYSLASPSSEDVPVIVEVVTDSPIGAALLATRPEMTVGAGQVLTAVVVEGDRTVSGASVHVTVMPESGQPLELVALDDGGIGDHASGDGLYSAAFVPPAPGRYSAVAEVRGTTSGGVAFFRQAATELVVQPRRSRLTGVLDDQGIDDDRDGRFDRIALRVGTETEVAGTYRAFVKLRSAGGKELLRSTEGELQAGPGSLQVDFEAAAVRALGEDGPYDIALVDLVFHGSDGAITADRLLDAGRTQAYLLSQFDRSGLLLTGRTSDHGVDDNGDGLFDRLVFSFEVDALRSGFLTWSLALKDGDSREIDFASGSGSFPAGTSWIQVSFSGRRIGDFGADGPYVVGDLLLYGSSGSVVAGEVGRTQAYLASQFPGTNRPPVADAGPDRSVECASPAGTLVVLDGSGSRDPEGRPLSYTWTGPFPEGDGTAAGMTPSVTLPIGPSQVSLVVHDGRLGSAPDTAVLRVVVPTKGLGQPLAALVEEGQALPLPPPFNQGRTLPLKLQMSCGGQILGPGDVEPPRIVALSRNGVPVDLAGADLDAGDANDDSLLFRAGDGQWIFNLSTRRLEAGTWTITLLIPDGRRLVAGFILR